MFFIVSRAMLACCTCCAVWMSRQHVVSVLTVRLTQSGCEDRKSEDIGAGMQLRGEGSITSLIKINDRYSCHSNVCSQFHRDDAMGWNRNDHHASVRTRAEHCKNGSFLPVFLHQHLAHSITYTTPHRHTHNEVGRSQEQKNNDALIQRAQATFFFKPGKKGHNHSQDPHGKLKTQKTIHGACFSVF